jgi:histidinol-phosphatase
LRYWAERGHGAFRASSDGRQQRLHTSQTSSLAGATTLLHPWPDATRPDVRALAEHWHATCRPVRRGWHHGLAVAAGEADAALAVSGGPWDFAAVVPIVEEAGGTFSDLDGGRHLDTNGAVITNGALAPAVAAVVAEGRAR